MTVSSSVQHTNADTLNQYAALLGLTSEQCAADTWATSTTCSPDGPCVEHHRDLSTIGGFTSYLSRLVLEETPGTPEVTVHWGGDYSGEEFSIPVDRIPALIDVLTAAHRTVVDSPKPLRRNPDVTVALMERDA